MMQNLYDGEEVFKLVIAGVSYDIDEPIFWDQVKIKALEDSEYYGFNYEFLEEETKLIFSFGYGGADLIRQQYESFSGDAEILLIYSQYLDNELINQLVCNINLNNYALTDEGVKASIEKTSFESKYRTRFDTKISLSAFEDLDGNLIDSITPFNMKLHSKGIVKISEQRTDPAFPISNPTTFQANNSTFMSFQFDSTNILVNNVEKLTSAPASLLDIPETNSLYLFDSVEGGEASFEVSGAIQSLTLGTFGQRLRRVNIYPVIKVQRAGILIENLILPAIYSNNINQDWFTILNLSYNVQFTRQLLAGDKVYVNLMISTPDNSGFLTHRLYGRFAGHTSNISVRQETVVDSSECRAYNLYDALNFAIYCATGKKDRLISEFLKNGCGKNYAITNGFQIRNFEIFDRPVMVSLKSMIKSINAIWNLGVGFANIDGEDFIYVEPQETFNGKKLLHSFPDVADYEEFHDSDLTFNEVVVGYEKFEDDKENTLDEFNTFREYLLPITSYKEKKILKSDFIASGYSIEIQRREQFAETPSDSKSLDDELFIINYALGNQYSNMNVKKDNSRVYVSKILQMSPGDSFILQDESVQYIVESRRIEGGMYAESYALTSSFGAVQSLFNVSLTVNPDRFVPVKNEDFETIENILSPQTVYNLKISPSRMMLNWRGYFNSMLATKQFFDKIKCTFAKNNGDAVTKLYDSEAECNFISRLKESQDFSVSLFREKVSSYKNKKIKFSARLSYSEFNYIKTSLRGEREGGLDSSGYIEFPNLSGQILSGYITEIGYDPVLEKCDLIIREKY
jgi:hypothetical protein